MKKLKLTDIAPYSGKRVQPFDGVKRYMSTGDLKGDNLSFEDVTYETKPSRADILVSEGDILFAKMTNTNKALQIDKDHDGIIVSTGFSVHRPLKNKLFGEYFLHFLKHNSFQRQKNKLCTGAIQSAISNTGIEKIFVPVPEYDDQLHIANLLSKAENLIAQRKESIRLLDEFLKSTFLEMFGDPKTNEKGFEIRNLTEFYINPKEGTKCGPFGSALKKDEYTETGIPVWTMDNILKTGEFNETGCLFVSEEKHKELERYNALNGDIIISRAGTVGKMCIVKTDTNKSVISSNLIRLRLGKNLLPIYFYSLMRYCQSRVIKLKHGNEDAYTHMSTGVLDEINFPYPNLKLQTQFAQIVEKTEALKSQYQQSLQELENLYGSLSQKAFRGELSVKQLAKA